jgi:hypothetical protein
MSVDTLPLPDVFSVSEVARAAGRLPRDVHALVRTGRVRTVDGEFLAEPEARLALSLLEAEASGAQPATEAGRPALFAVAPTLEREAMLPVAIGGGRAPRRRAA